jgi:hypothetical protein
MAFDNSRSFPSQVHGSIKGDPQRGGLQSDVVGEIPQAALFAWEAAGMRPPLLKAWRRGDWIAPRAAAFGRRSMQASSDHTQLQLFAVFY